MGLDLGELGKVSGLSTGGQMCLMRAWWLKRVSLECCLPLSTFLGLRAGNAALSTYLVHLGNWKK